MSGLPSACRVLYEATRISCCLCGMELKLPKKRLMTDIVKDTVRMPDVLLHNEKWVHDLETEHLYCVDCWCNKDKGVE